MASVPQARLTKEQARRIVHAVFGDPNAKESIGLSNARYLPASWGLAGSVRNIGFMIKEGTWFTGKGPSNEVEAQVCTGIARATATAINKAKIPGIALSMPVDRGTKVAHTATNIQMVRFGSVVFDWHATLQIYNPLIYHSVNAFQNDGEPVQYIDFQGF